MKKYHVCHRTHRHASPLAQPCGRQNQAQGLQLVVPQPRKYAKPKNGVKSPFTNPSSMDMSLCESSSPQNILATTLLQLLQLGSAKCVVLGMLRSRCLDRTLQKKGSRFRRWWPGFWICLSHSPKTNTAATLNPILSHS